MLFIKYIIYIGLSLCQLLGVGRIWFHVQSWVTRASYEPLVVELWDRLLLTPGFFGNGINLKYLSRQKKIQNANSLFSSSMVFFTADVGVWNVDSPTAQKWASDSSLVELLHLCF